MKSNNIYIYNIILFVLVLPLSLSAQLLSPAELENKKVYTSIEEGLQNPSEVYRLKLVGKPKMDSLPNSIFQFVNLQELTIKKCKLSVLNFNIDTFALLQYLNLENNRLIRLPQSVSNLLELKQLIINRNIMEALPDSIGNLSKLSYIDAWDTRLYVLPKSISKLASVLKVIDLRQVPINDVEYDNMVYLLPKTEIIITSICECSNDR